MTDTTQITIESARRTETGKSYTRKLRKAGKVPAVLLDKGKSSLIELDPKQLPKAWKSNDRKFNLVLDGKTSLVKIQELQVDPVKRHCLHVDLMFV